MTGGQRVDNAKAKQELGWAPEVPDCSTGAARIAAHYRREAA